MVTDGITISMFADVASAVTMAMRTAAKTGNLSVHEDDVVREAAAYTTSFGDLMPIARGVYPIDTPIALAPDGTDTNTGTEPHLAILLSTMWLLMQQPLVVETTEQTLDLKTARKLRRNHEHIPTVRLIDLRRTRGDHPGEPGNRNYQHQWMVRGHWRKQWLPSLGIHRPTWVRPHIKGPEGKPILLTDKVNVWRR